MNIRTKISLVLGGLGPWLKVRWKADASFFDGRNFDDGRIFYADPQMKMWNGWILWKMRKITKSGQFSKIGRVKCDIFFLEEFFDDSL